MDTYWAELNWSAKCFLRIEEQKLNEERMETCWVDQLRRALSGSCLTNFSAMMKF